MTELWTDHISFSQITSAEECPYQYYLLRMIGVDAVENPFAQAGTLAHKLLALWAKGEISKEELLLQWVQRFQSEVTAEFPRYLAAKGYGAKLFDSIFTYFENFDGFPDYEVIESEKEFQSSIAGERFVGIADLILRNKETKKLMIVDFKSSSLASFKRNKEKMYRQLYLYSKYSADAFGEFPEKLRFELIKENTYDECLFDREDFVAARLWAENAIEAMKSKEITDWFETKPEYFRCLNLCSCRNECPYGNSNNHERKKKVDESRKTKATA